MMDKPRRRLVLALLIIALVLGGCAVAPPEQAARPAEPELLRKAQRAADSGDYEAAAREYVTLAATASELKRPEYLLQAVSVLLRGNYIEPARRILDTIDARTLHAQQRIRRQLLAARIALAENKAREALDLLRPEITSETPAPLQAEVHALRAEAYLRAGNLIEAARERVRREPFLDPGDREAVARNQQALWQTLMRLSDEALQAMRSEPPPDIFSGWLELAHIAKQAESRPVDVRARIAAWRERYPSHPAADDIIALLLARQEQEIRRPTRIALLLPQSGPVSGVAEALRDGFLTAHYSRTNRAYQPSIRIYDVGPDPSAAAAVYARAVRDGAEFVVGPLRKEAVNRVIEGRRLRVPTLTLNYGGDSGTGDPQLYQFGLAPEDEARQVAERAWLDGHNHALAIVPEGEWGQRLLEAFRQDWERLGGTLLESQTYAPEDNDFSRPIKQLLNLDEGERRHAALEALLQQRLEYRPRRRQDAGFVFMAAFPRQARLIRPQLRFHYASRLPVYSTSHLFTGTPERHADRDMDGVIFCDIPWVLDDSGARRALKDRVGRLWPERSRQYTRFYALGIDAYNIIPYLNNLREFPYERYNGETGILQLGPDHRLFRRLEWARFKNGLPYPYD